MWLGILSGLFKLLILLWPVWLWFVARDWAASWADGTVYYRTAIAAAPLVLFGLSILGSALGGLSQGMIWVAAAAAAYSGYLGLEAEYARWQPYWGTPGYGWWAVLRHADHPLLLTSLLGLGSPVIVGALFQGGGLVWLRGYRRGYRRAASDAHGSAEWMSLREAKKILGDGPLVIGEAYEPQRHPNLGGKAPLLRYRADQGHLVTVAGARSGKSVSIAIPNCLLWDGSLVVHDPKGELAELCAPSRRARGRRVFVLDPANPETDGVNVLDWLDPGSDRIVEDAAAVVSWLGTGLEEKGENGSFKGNAQKLIQLLILEVMCKEGLSDDRRHLGTVRDLLTMPNLVPILEAIAGKRDTGYAHGAAPQFAAELAALAEAAPETWGGVLFEASALTSWLSTPSLARLVTGKSQGQCLRTRDLTSGKIDVFVCVPLKTLISTPAVSRLIFGALLNTLYEAYQRTRKAPPRTLFLLDEMPRLGYMALLETARDAGAGMGVTLWSIVQDLGQLEKHYGAEGMRGWLENTQIKNFFGINEKTTAELISETLGDTTIEIETQSWSRGNNSGQAGLPGGGWNRGVNVNQGLLARRLLTPDELMRLRVDEDGVPDEQIVLVRGRRPLRCGMAKWYRRQDLSALI